MTGADLASLTPALLLAASAAAATVLGSTIKASARVLGWLGALSCIGAAAIAIAIGPAVADAGAAAPLGGTVVRDGASVFFVALIGVAAAASLAVGAADPHRRSRSVRSGAPADEVALILFSAGGAVLVVSAADLVVLFVGLALLTVPLYVLTARWRTQGGDERVIRHFLLGATSSATALYGIALLYAATGETGYLGLGRATHNPLYLGGLALALAGLVFHTVLAPAQRSSIVVNIAIVGALLRLVGVTQRGEVALDWEVSLAALAALALVSGLAALTERRLGWLIGYAAISQLGYVLLAAAGSAFPAAAFAIAAAAALAVGLFGVLALVPRDEPTLDDLAGLARARPLVTLALGVLVGGLIGVPPTVGFLSKLYVFESAVRGQLLWLVVLGALASVIGAASYARVALACFAPRRLEAIAPSRARAGTALVVLAAIAILLLGVLPGPLLDAAQAVRF